MKTKAINKEADYRVNATLIVNGIEFTDVPCNIYLPDRINEKPFVVFKPEAKDAQNIWFHCGSFRASVLGADKQPQVTLESPDVWFDAKSTKYWGSDIQETTIPGIPQHLLVTRHSSGAAERTKPTKIRFWISPNKLLSPAILSEESCTGDVTTKRVWSLEFPISDKATLKFDTHFKSKQLPDNDTLRWSFLVASTELDLSAADATTINEATLPLIDDFLLLASLAARTKTACLGWDASTEVSMLRYYRGNQTFPDSTNKSTNEGLVDIQHIEQFMNVCFASFCKMPNKVAIRSALFSIVPSKPQTLELSFLHKFSGLEALVLEYRKQNKLEYALDEGDWKKLKSYLEGCIGKLKPPSSAIADLTLDKKQRKSIYDKLGELNRIPLQEAYQSFCSEYGIDLSDLWSVFGSKNAVGLVDIRNKLIHGDPLPDSLIDAVGVANQHLAFTLERALVSVLGWDIEKTRVQLDSLQHYTAIQQFSNLRTELSQYLASGHSV